MLTKMEFLNPTFHKGLNVTVRLGTKWMHKLEPGKRLNLVKTGEDNGQEAYVSGCRSLVFSEITEDMILKEHDPDCRTVEGLAACLRETYEDFTEDSIVTVVSFTVPE